MWCGSLHPNPDLNIRLPQRPLIPSCQETNSKKVTQSVIFREQGPSGATFSYWDFELHKNTLT